MHKPAHAVVHLNQAKKTHVHASTVSQMVIHVVCAVCIGFCLNSKVLRFFKCNGYAMDKNRVYIVCWVHAGTPFRLAMTA